MNKNNELEEYVDMYKINNLKTNSNKEIIKIKCVQIRTRVVITR